MSTLSFQASRSKTMFFSKTDKFFRKIGSVFETIRENFKESYSGFQASIRSYFLLCSRTISSYILSKKIGFNIIL